MNNFLKVIIVFSTITFSLLPCFGQQLITQEHFQSDSSKWLLYVDTIFIDDVPFIPLYEGNEGILVTYGGKLREVEVWANTPAQLADKEKDESLLRLVFDYNEQRFCIHRHRKLRKGVKGKNHLRYEVAFLNGEMRLIWMDPEPSGSLPIIRILLQKEYSDTH